MNNSKRSIHSSGPLGMLVKSGQVKKVEESEDAEVMLQAKEKASSYFKTQSGIKFFENELLYVDPRECEPWKYANRQQGEMGNIEELAQSIKDNKQLQPALVRKHPNSHDGMQYEIIFGRRRHAACLLLGIPFLVICKDISNLQEAVASQDAENKLRDDISPYSNAILYKRLLEDGVFSKEADLAKMLKISASSLSELMVFSKLPNELVKKIPNVHALSRSFAAKLFALSSSSTNEYKKILELAPQIGKKISSPVQLQKIIDKGNAEDQSLNKAKVCKSNQGQKLFTLKYDRRGVLNVVIAKDVMPLFSISDLEKSLKKFLETHIS